MGPGGAAAGGGRTISGAGAAAPGSGKTKGYGGGSTVPGGKGTGDNKSDADSKIQGPGGMGHGRSMSILAIISRSRVGWAMVVAEWVITLAG